MGKIDNMRQEVRLIKGQLKLKMEELHAAQSAEFRLKVGDLLLKKEGEYGNPTCKVYMISKLDFRTDQTPIMYGRQRLKDGVSFHSTETVLCFRADELPMAIGHVDHWQKILRVKSKTYRGSWLTPPAVRSSYLVGKPFQQMSNSSHR
ncbi:hypothetical protein [Acidisarcina polymorpha]|uniref:hypothetical protein n=1 Tax=Acidisarcina polymorpha TaxID=2211140 RepID=UPI000DEED681|nr:hypothetical protein [Acidisarcina polymorpha]